MRFLPSLLAISLACFVSSCTTHDRAQYSDSYRPPVHVARDKHAPQPSEAAPQAAAPAAATAPAAH